MSKLFLDAVKDRRSYYDIKGESTISNERIEEIISEVVKYSPSAFNSQSSRIVLLLEANHKEFWDLTEEELKKVTPEEKFEATAEKVESFRKGYATLLFFEEMEIVQDLQKRFPLYAENFLKWSEHTNAIHQFAVWSALEAEGLGASLQHYTELVQERVKERWDLPSSWKLIAQMPFGTPNSQPADKEMAEVSGRFLIKK